MATLTVATVSKMAYLLVLASILSVAFADEATTSSVDTLPNYFNEYVMGITLSADSSPQGVVCKIAPLTTEAGLNQTNENALQAFDIEGNLILVDRTNYNKLSDLEDTIAYISCESSTDNTYLSPEDVLNSVMAAKPKGILLFTTSGAYCNLGGSDLDYTSLWTTTDSEDAGMIKNMTTDSTGGTVHAAITGNSIDSDSDNGQPQGGGNSAVAMSILYSITGLITLLFLIIIATGAIRAHRHPERYGPRPGFNGRPRQSRARGLARAVLETLPIVKFGDPHPSKPDPENELDSISGDRQQNSASPTPRELASDNAEQAGSSPEAAANATSGAISKGTASAAVSGEATGTNGQTEDGHLGCSICTEDFSVGQDVRVLPCDHKFHPQCIDPWLVNVSGTCPLCRLDLRPQEAGEDDAGELGIQEAQPNPAVENHDDRHLAPSPEDEGDRGHRRRMSRLLDWNRLRHAPVDERIQALRQYRQTQQTSTPGSGSADDQSRHAKLSDRLREKFHIRTRAHSAHPPSDDLPSTSQ